MLPGFILGGLGMAFVMTPMSAAVMGAAPVDKAGVASGVLNTFPPGRRRARDRDHGRDHHEPRAGGRPRRRRPPHAFVHGLTFGMRVSARDLPRRRARGGGAHPQLPPREQAQPLAEAA
jgi:hypothetical protein